MNTGCLHFGPDFGQRGHFRDQLKRDVFPKLTDHVTGVNFLFVLEMRQTIKIRTFPPYCFRQNN